jgi:hypothetical protein
MGTSLSAGTGGWPKNAAKHLYIGAALTAVLRPLVWMLSFGIIGTLLGLAEFTANDVVHNAGPVATDVWVSASFGLTALGVVLAIASGVWVGGASAASARFAMVLAVVFFLDSAAYLTGLGIAAVYVLNYALADGRDGFVALGGLAVAMVVFGYLTVTSVLILRQATAAVRGMRSASEAVATH